jgi:hypothetical protein
MIKNLFFFKDAPMMSEILRVTSIALRLGMRSVQKSFRWVTKFCGGSVTNFQLRKGDRNSAKSEPPHGGENENHSIFINIETI